MAQKKTLKQKIWRLLKTFYWKYLSSIDAPWKHDTVGEPPMYLPSFFKIYTPEEAEEIMEEDRKFFEAELKAFGEWERAWREEEAKASLEIQNPTK
ncbi:MAG: hypothetical protein HFI67_07335 [Lachnospiraceae bacterium]|jgi:hypothetical protein|nr:hypothetical protein [Lachnospiraceae bacterium]